MNDQGLDQRLELPEVLVCGLHLLQLLLKPLQGDRTPVTSAAGSGPELGYADFCLRLKSGALVHFKVYSALLKFPFLETKPLL